MLVANFTRKDEEIELDGLWQYDYGQKLQINGLNLPAIFEVHFFWQGLENAKIMTGHTENGVSSVDIPNEALIQRRVITAYIYLSSAEEGETTNTIQMLISKRPAPQGFETPEDIDLFHYTIATVAEYLKQTENARDVSINKSIESESWAHGHADYPDRDTDNAAYYASEAKNAAKEVPGRVKEGKQQIDDYVREKESQLKGETGNVYFAGFAVVKGRLKMYSDPTVDKVRFRREGSRLKYRLTL